MPGFAIFCPSDHEKHGSKADSREREAPPADASRALIDAARAAAAIISHAWHWGGPAPAHASGGVC
jgi:hypothetical protein